MVIPGQSVSMGSGFPYCRYIFGTPVKKEFGQANYVFFWHGFRGLHGFWLFCFCTKIQAPELLVHSTRQRRINPPEDGAHRQCFTDVGSLSAQGRCR